MRCEPGISNVMPSPSFEEKVETLRRLREKRQARAAATASVTPTAETVKAVRPNKQSNAEDGQWQQEQQSEPVLEGVHLLQLQQQQQQKQQQSRWPHEKHEELQAQPEPEPSEGESGRLDGQRRSSWPDPCSPGGAGEVDALFCAGHCHEHGLHGCKLDLKAAYAFYLEAAEQGLAVAQWRLGEFFEFGRGVAQRDSEAVRWYRRAADAGSVPAQAGLALMLEAGRGCDQDDDAALRWHLSAAEAGHALSQYCVFQCLSEGRGGKRDLDEASRWLQLSAAAGFGPAVEELASISTKPAAGAETVKELGQEDLGESLLSLASRLTQHLQDMDTADAEAMVQELLLETPT